MPSGVYKRKPSQGFQKGQKGYWLGKHRKHSEKSKRKMREAQKKYHANGGLASMKGKHHSEDTKRKIGEKNDRGNSAGYRAKHYWISRHFGKPTKCEDCGKDGLTGRQIHWANISGEYKKEISDWKRLCKKCHGEFDKQNNSRKHKVLIN